MYEYIFQTPFTIHSFVTSYIAELRALQQPGGVGRGVAQRRPNHWLAPPEGLSKVNVDAAVGRVNGAVAAVCRDREGVFMGASAVVFPHLSDPGILETLAIREALALADDLYARRIHVASDCKVAVDDIQHSYKGSYDTIVHEIMQFRLSFETCNNIH